MNIIKKIGLFFLDIIETGVIALSLFVIVYLFILQPHEVKGSSMSPNFEHGDFLLTDKISYQFRKPQRGDIVVFHAPLNSEFDYIKRIIGLPGERVRIASGQVYINGKQVIEPYLPEGITSRSGRVFREGKTMTISEDEYFVMGDNRNHSSDSRDWGTVPRNNIVGKVWIRYWPPDSFGKIEKVNYRLIY